VLSAFGLCAAAAPAVDVWNQPETFENRFLGAFPNPASSNRLAIQYTLAAPGAVQVRIYNVAGAKVQDVTVTGKAGPNRYVWNGVTSGGTRVAPGVYFVRIGVDGGKKVLQAGKVVVLNEAR
jgi:hypothetical protein